MESRRDRTGQKNILLSCPISPRLHARSRLYEFGVYISLYYIILARKLGSFLFFRTFNYLKSVIT